MNQKTNGQQAYQLYPLGKISRTDKKICIEIEEAYRPALTQLEHFTHVTVFWWANHLDTDEGRAYLEVTPPYAAEHVSGVFATRSPARPNPIMTTTCKIIALDKTAGSLEIGDIDAYDGTPVVDLKAYFPVCDRVKDAKIPEWLVGWPEWMPENGIGLEAGEE